MADMSPGSDEAAAVSILTAAPMHWSTDALSDIDLRLLQAAAVVDVERFPFGEHVQDRLTPLPMAVAGVLHATKG
jgi:hypothetical protein